jgi:uncharacterized membrane protein YfcA
MIIFAILMLAAAISMIRNKQPDERAGDNVNDRPASPGILLLLGLIVGVVTGLLGAGGGFLIIPSLVLFLRLPMKAAVGTSLFIIAMNSLLGFLFSLRQFEYDWTVLLVFSALAIAGIFIGSAMADKISGPSLKKWFGWFVLAMGFFIIIKEIFLR